jgi:hypothetical protein
VKVRSLTIAVFLCLTAATSGISAAARHRLGVSWNVPVTAPGGSHLNWYELKADPEDGSHLIVCGAKRNAQDNAYYGVVYSSKDGGRSWEIALEDRSSTWVSEQSCAFGPRHMAYFISEASKVIDGELHHALGTTHVFVSSDGGETWRETAKTDWADYSTSIVGGERAPQLYVFYNSNSGYDASKKLGSSLGFFTVSADGRKISPRHIVPDMVRKDYQGVYPSSSAALKDGSVTVLYNARTKEQAAGSDVATFLQVGVVRITSNGLLTSSIIADIASTTQPTGCPLTLSNSLTYDSVHDVLYAAYNEMVAGKCEVMLTRSHDGGRTWTASHELRGGIEDQFPMYFPVLTVNRDGVIGLLWRGTAEKSPGCWFFSAFRDGVKFEGTVSLSACRQERSLRDQSSEYLATFISHQARWQSIAVDLATLRDYLMRAGISASPDGVFHPIWSTMEGDCDELRTARVQIADNSRSIATRPIQTPGLSDVTDEFTALYGGEERLDHETNSVTIELSFRNDSSRAITAPLYLKIEQPTSPFGDIEFVNSSPAPSLGLDYVDLSSIWRTGSLATKATTPPFQLVFHFSDEIPALIDRYFILKFRLRLFCLPPLARYDRFPDASAPRKLKPSRSE